MELEFIDPLPEFEDTLPDGRWQFFADLSTEIIVADPIDLIPPCKFEDHLWTLEIEEGRANVYPKDPHTSVEREAMRRWAEQEGTGYYGGICQCYSEVALPDYIFGEFIVKINYHDDSSPAGPWGEAEYGYYLTFEPVIADESTGSADATNDSG